jgi:hypothetical protein
MSSFHAEIITHPDKEMLIYLRYLAAKQLYQDAFDGCCLSTVDNVTKNKLRKNLCAAEKEAIREIIK